VAGPAVGTAIREMLAAKGIDYHPAHQVERVDPERRTLVFSNGTEASPSSFTLSIGSSRLVIPIL